MLIATNYLELPNTTTTNNGVIIMGAGVNQVASSLSMMTYAKFLGHASYSVARSTYAAISPGGVFKSSFASTFAIGAKGASEDHIFFYQSTPVSEYLAVVLVYAASAYNARLPFIDVELRAIVDLGAGNLQVGGIVDTGIRFSFPDTLEGDNRESARSAAYIASTGADKYGTPTNLPPSVTPDIPRPLYIPLQDTGGVDIRGDMVAVRVECSECHLLHCHLFDIYQPDITV